MIAGRAAQRQFVGLNVGTTLKWGESIWTLVGIFEDGGSVSESELWCDVKVLQPAFRRGNSYQSVYARLASTDAFQQLKDSLTANPQLTVSAMRAPEYYGSQTETLQRIIRTIGGIIALLMGVGAVFGAVITMYTAVASRTREIATLRALGFGALPVVVSVLAEGALLSLVGGLIGGAIAWAAFDGYETATMNFQSFSQIAFAFAVTPALIGNGPHVRDPHGPGWRTAACHPRCATAGRYSVETAVDRDRPAVMLSPGRSPASLVRSSAAQPSSTRVVISDKRDLDPYTRASAHGAPRQTPACPHAPPNAMIRSQLETRTPLARELQFASVRGLLLEGTPKL